MSEIKALSNHYPRRQLAAADHARWLTDYAQDLAGFDAMDVRLACHMWRASEEKHMPTPGELIAKCNKVVRPGRGGVQTIEPPQRAVPSEADREYVWAGLKQLHAELASRPKTLAKKGGETDAAFARRVWPDRERRPRQHNRGQAA